VMKDSKYLIICSIT